MSLLDEKFQTYDEMGNTEDQLKQRIQILLNENKDNKPLMEYLELTDELSKVKQLQEDKKIKDELYTLASQEGIDFWEGNNFTFSLVKEYTKKDLDKLKLEKEFPEAYKECLIDKPVKGHITTKRKLFE